MKTWLIRGVSCLILAFALPCRAAVLYVDLNSINPTPPYSDWSTAATNIQDAVDASSDGDLIWVTNGVYQVGTTIMNDGWTNRVAVTNAITLQSVNGAAVTWIDGAFTVRCVYLSDGATITGFTLTNGNAPNGGGIHCTSTNALVLNCVLIGNMSAPGGGAYSGTLNNCMLTGNGAYDEGGGAYGCLMNNCWLSGNSANNGGGAASSILNNCVISNNATLQHLFQLGYQPGIGGGAYACSMQNCIIVSNSAIDKPGLDGPTPEGSGGGACGSTLINCVLRGNSANVGGGVYNMAGNTLSCCTLIGNQASRLGGGFFGGIGGIYPSLTNCIIHDNWAGLGGGVYSGQLVDCVVSGNWATNSGGGAYLSELFNCTVCQNTATNQGGGVWGTFAENSIIYYNTAPNGSNYFNFSPSYCCTTPLPSDESGCLTNEPLFANLADADFHLQSNSPCINSGNNAYVAVTTDLDGNPRIVGGTVDIGAYEYETPASVISYAWLQQYGLPTDGSVDYADLDGTPFNVYQDWIAGLNPTNPASVLVMFPPVATNTPSGLTVSWQSVNTRTYFLQSSTNLVMQPAFSTIQSNIAGQAGITSYTDTTATNAGPYFYRVGVQQ